MSNGNGQKQNKYKPREKQEQAMHKIITSAMVLALLVCATNAHATSAGLAVARKNLYSAQMSSYNAQIKYYQSASLHYLKKMPALTARKYGYSYKKPSSSYKKPSYSYKKPSYSYKSSRPATPTASTVNKAINASSVSELMSALKGWGH